MHIAAAMDAASCLNTSAKKLESVLTLHKNNFTDIHHRCRQRFSFSSSFPSNVGLRTRPTIWLRPVVRQENANVAIKNKKIGGIVAKSAAVTMVMACTLGGLCPSWNRRAPSLPRATSDDDEPFFTHAHGNSIQDKSIEVLWEIFQRKCEVGITPAMLSEAMLSELRNLCDQHGLSEEYLHRLETSEKGDSATDSLHKEWESKGDSHEALDIGLLLIDVLINQGDNERADSVCQKIETLASENDFRPKIHRVVINMMLLADAIEAEVKDTDKGRKMKKEMDKSVFMLIKLLKEISVHPLSPTETP